MAGTGDERETGGGTPGSDNYVVWAKDGTLLIVSGKTGNITAVKPEHKEQVESLIRQRQGVGLKLSQLLEDQGYVVAPSWPTHVVTTGKDKPK